MPCGRLFDKINKMITREAVKTVLRIIYGRAGTGKTARIMDEIKNAVLSGRKDNILLVPEQFSHEAERELCAVCGDSVSLYAEVLSFTGLCRRVSGELGGIAVPYLDKGGRLLCMARAVDGLYSSLKMFSSARHKAELQSILLDAVDELKSACITPEELMRASEDNEGALSDKLYDLSLLLSGFDAVTANGSADPADRLTILAQQIGDSSVSSATHIYVDGFTGLTVQERRVIEALLRKGAELSLILGIDELYGDSEVFEMPRRLAHSLIAYAKENGIGTELIKHGGETRKAPVLGYFDENMFSWRPGRFEGDASALGIFSAADMETECEFAAARAVELVRETGCRYRDIAVAVRGFEDYRLALTAAFAQYGVPLYTAAKTDLMSKPLPALISSAYEITLGGWELDDVLDYIRTGLAGLSDDECDELENYAYTWQLRGSAWTREEDWKLHPDGYGADFSDGTWERLNRVNALRRRVSAPLIAFAESAAAAHTATEQAQALAGLLNSLGLSKRLAEKADRLYETGRAQAAQEYSQLWDICVAALEQSAAILGDAETDAESFGRLFTMMLSRYDVGTIPATLDSVTAGDYDRMRRRNIKHLLVLGMNEARIPKSEEDTGVFSSEERRRLLEDDIDLGGIGDCELWREFSLIYNCLTLPSESLSLCMPLFDSAGEQQRASFIIRRASAITGREAESVKVSELRMNAPAPALFLAANSFRGGGVEATSAAELFKELMPERMDALRRAAELKRGSLSSGAVQKLYGRDIRLSASKIDKFASCRFAYFMQYGLKAKTREPAGFTPPEMGTFMHYILENVAHDVMESGGFAEADDDKLDKLTDKYIAQYVHDKLNDFREKSKRFEYLFRRLTKDVRRVVEDMAAELRCSDFKPLSFELDFGKSDVLPPMKLGDDGDSLVLTGIADRVDGWLHDGKLYIRVVDYKTGTKSFSLEDVWYGMGLQMLLYLFSLEQNGKLLYGEEIVPAGVLYVPAKDVIISRPHDAPDDSIAKEKQEKIRRSGLLLEDRKVLLAMEKTEEPRFIPVTFKEGVPRGDALASAEKLGLLSKHIDKTLREMASELRKGSIAADPFYRNQKENACLNCDYFEACHFSDGENGESLRQLPALKATKVWSMLSGGEENG